MPKENDHEIHTECVNGVGLVRRDELRGRCQEHQLLPQWDVLQERRVVLQEEDAAGQAGRLLPERQVLQERLVLQEDPAVLAA
jgi:hypothetical protein